MADCSETNINWLRPVIGLVLHAANNKTSVREQILDRIIELRKNKGAPRFPKTPRRC